MFFASINMNSLQAQDCWHEIDVTWLGDCVYPDDNSVYVINMTIINECSDPDETVFTETKTLATTNTNTIFCIVDELCTADQVEPCFRIHFTLAKVHAVTHAVICSMQLSLPLKNCEQLMNFDAYTLTLN